MPSGLVRHFDPLRSIQAARRLTLGGPTPSFRPVASVVQAARRLTLGGSTPGFRLPAPIVPPRSPHPVTARTAAAGVAMTATTVIRPRPPTGAIRPASAVIATAAAVASAPAVTPAAPVATAATAPAATPASPAVASTATSALGVGDPDLPVPERRLQVGQERHDQDRQQQNSQISQCPLHDSLLHGGSHVRTERRCSLGESTRVTRCSSRLALRGSKAGARRFSQKSEQHESTGIAESLRETKTYESIEEHLAPQAGWRWHGVLAAKGFSPVLSPGRNRSRRWGAIRWLAPSFHLMKPTSTHRPSASFVMIVVSQEKCSMKMLSGKCSGAVGGWGWNQREPTPALARTCAARSGDSPGSP